ncbi:hypothetical protein [Aquibaculum sediminis]|uniref:hypothetical protein n=1 Tax=Aquibaculum sediminis TaxID=3231907 RepID=UPI003455A85D
MPYVCGTFLLFTTWEIVVRPETRLFLSRWLAKPTQVASLYPSSPKLSAHIAAKALRTSHERVLYLGAGTGAVGAAMVLAGLPESQLVMVELDANLCEHLRSAFPEALVLEGDALNPAALLPPEWAGQITTCVSGLPIVHYGVEKQRRFVEQVFSLMSEPRLVQYGNLPRPPIAHRQLGLAVKRLGFGWSGVVPHFIWEFRPNA